MSKLIRQEKNIKKFQLCQTRRYYLDALSLANEPQLSIRKLHRDLIAPQELQQWLGPSKTKSIKIYRFIFIKTHTHTEREAVSPRCNSLSIRGQWRSGCGAAVICPGCGVAARYQPEGDNKMPQRLSL